MNAPLPLHTKTIGDIAEAYVAARLLEVGYTVLKPLGDNRRFDLVIERDGALGTQVRLRFTPARNGQAKGIRFAKDYEL